jgi:hypothetical protein
MLLLILKSNQRREDMQNGPRCKHVADSNTDRVSCIGADLQGPDELGPTPVPNLGKEAHAIDEPPIISGCDAKRHQGQIFDAVSCRPTKFLL